MQKYLRHWQTLALCAASALTALLLLVVANGASLAVERDMSNRDQAAQIANAAADVARSLYGAQLEANVNPASTTFKDLLNRIATGSRDVGAAIRALKTSGLDPAAAKPANDMESQWQAIDKAIQNTVANAAEAEAAKPTESGGYRAAAALNSGNATAQPQLRKFIDNAAEMAKGRSEAATAGLKSLRAKRLVAFLLAMAAVVAFWWAHLMSDKKRENETSRIAELAREAMKLSADDYFVLGGNGKVEFATVSLFPGNPDREALVGSDFGEALILVTGEPKRIGNISRFVDKLYDASVGDEEISRANPLKELELPDPASENEEGDIVLGFAFKRLAEGERIARVLARATNLTTLKSMQSLRQRAEKSDDLLNEVIGIVFEGHAKQLMAYLQTAGATINNVNRILGSQGMSESELAAKIDGIEEQIDLSIDPAYDLKLYSHHDCMLKIRATLKQLRQQSAEGHITGNDFLPIAIKLDELVELQNYAYQAISKFKSYDFNTEFGAPKAANPKPQA